MDETRCIFAAVCVLGGITLILARWAFRIHWMVPTIGAGMVGGGVIVYWGFCRA